MPIDPKRQIRAVATLLERLHGEGFYGEIIVRMERGNVLYARKAEIKRIEDLVAEAESTRTPP